MVWNKGKGWHSEPKRHSEASKKGWQGRKNRIDITNKNDLRIFNSAIHGSKGGLSIELGNSPDYYRPTKDKIKDIEKFKDDLKDSKFKNMTKYSLGKIKKRESSPTGYEMSIFNIRTGEFIDHIIVDKSGKIPERQGILRLMDVESGGTKGRRSVDVDLGETALKIYKKDEKGNWRWYMNPNKSDIEHIDTNRTVFGKSYEKLRDTKQKKAQKKIVILARNEK